MTYDVIVIGLGAMGGAATYQLAARGVRVLGIDRFAPPHAWGSSHGESRIIRHAYFEHPDYVPLLSRAYELWERLERESGAAVLRLTGGLMLGPAASEVVRGSLRSAREHALAHELLTAEALSRRYPTLAPAAGEVGLYEAHAGILRPEKAVAAHLDLARRHGAELRYGQRVDRWSATPDGVAVQIGDERLAAGRLVVAPGPWATAGLGLGRALEPVLQVVRKVQFWFDAGPATDAWTCAPIFIWETPDGASFYGIPPETAAEGVKTAIHSGGEAARPDTLDRSVRATDVEAMRALLRDRLPSLAAAPVVRSAVCMYTLTPDTHFVLGLHPEHPNVAVACGFSGHGFKFASVVGEILADLAVDGATRHPIGLFDPARFAFGNSTRTKERSSCST